MNPDHAPKPNTTPGEQPQQQSSSQPQQSTTQPAESMGAEKIESFEAGENMVVDVRRHPFGLYVLYLQIILALGLSLIVIFAFLPSVSTTLGVPESTVNGIAAIFGLIAISFGLIFIVLATKVYTGNRLIVSNRNITHVKQVGIFNKHTAELSMSNVEDVSIHKTGIFPSVFNYGELKIETAGEQRNFEYKYCPKPDAVATAILNSRSNFSRQKH